MASRFSFKEWSCPLLELDGFSTSIIVTHILEGFKLSLRATTCSVILLIPICSIYHIVFRYASQCESSVRKVGFWKFHDAGILHLDENPAFPLPKSSLAILNGGRGMTVGFAVFKETDHSRKCFNLINSLLSIIFFLVLQSSGSPKMIYLVITCF